jgi:hypothetical protein
MSGFQARAGMPETGSNEFGECIVDKASII